MREEKLKKYSLFSAILIALGPIIWLFINLHDKRYEDIVLNIILVVVGVAMIIFNVIIYRKDYNSKSNVFLSILSHIGSFVFYIILLALIVIVFIGFGAGISFVQEKLFVKETFILNIGKYPYSNLIFLILTLVIVRMVICFSEKKNFFSMSKELPIYYRFDKFLLLMLPIIYLIVTNVVIVSDQGIYDYSFYNLKGNKYSFNDVECVNTGFIESGKSKGEFFYNIQLTNGKTFKLAHPSMISISDEYESDSWQEYVDIDKYIMDSGAKKQSSEDGSEHVRMDKIYVDKLLTVVRNK